MNICADFHNEQSNSCHAPILTDLPSDDRMHLNVWYNAIVLMTKRRMHPCRATGFPWPADRMKAVMKIDRGADRNLADCPDILRKDMFYGKAHVPDAGSVQQHSMKEADHALYL